MFLNLILVFFLLWLDCRWLRFSGCFVKTFFDRLLQISQISINLMKILPRRTVVTITYFIWWISLMCWPLLSKSRSWFYLFFDWLYFILSRGLSSALACTSFPCLARILYRLFFRFFWSISTQTCISSILLRFVIGRRFIKLLFHFSTLDLVRVKVP